jgi:aryl-alcohol dehydrogenase-like predicted oxidoreductase
MLHHNSALVEVVKKVAAGKGVIPGQVALAWLLARKPWIVPIPGTTRESRLDENVGAANVVLGDDELEVLKSALADVGIQGARYPDFAERQTNL